MTAVDLDELAGEFKLFADTSSLMHPHAAAFFTGSLKQALLGKSARLIVPLEVVRELEKHAAASDAAKQQAAAAGLAIIKDYTAAGLIDIRSDEQDAHFADNTFLYVFTRFRTRYHLALITQDGALARDIQHLASQEAVQSRKRIWVFSLSRDDPPQLRRRSRPRPNNPHDQPGFKFRLFTEPAPATGVPIPIKEVPGAGATVCSARHGQVKLIQRLAGGGEGDIFTTSAPGLVCKIYSRPNLTVSRREKIQLMLKTAVDCLGVCWPQDLVTDAAGTFCGYLMPQADGEPMQTSMFVKPVLLKKHPDWTRRHLVVLALTILDKISYLHAMNVIIGDINPLNILIKDERTVYFVDTDSYQIENYPCPVGTVNYTAPEIQGRDYQDFLRTFDHEYFALATLMFMILHPGKPPYSQQGGGSPAENIVNMDFAYPLGGKSTGKAPEGPWKFIWSNLPYKTKELFYQVFQENKRFNTGVWRANLLDYLDLLDKGFVSDELFPTRRKVVEPVAVQCSLCGGTFEESREYLDKLRGEGKSFICDQCREQRFSKLQATCSRCQRPTQVSPAKLEELKRQGKQVLCPDCVAALKATATVYCERCGAVFTDNAERLNQLRAQGKRWLCSTCRAAKRMPQYQYQKSASGCLLPIFGLLCILGMLIWIFFG